MTTAIVWGSFLSGVVLLVVIDLELVHRQAKLVTARQAMTRWSVWFAIALLFNVYVYFLYETNWLGWGLTSILDLDGRQAATLFITGYLIELSLSVDNVFVFVLIFTAMRVPAEFQYRVLFWGVLGAIVMRAIMIGLGIALMHRFDWMTYVFGTILLLSAARMLTIQEDSSFESNIVTRLARNWLPITNRYHGTSFTVVEGGKRMATPLLLTLVMVEWADVVFAVDSIPAIFAITTDPFLVFTSNVFAILGLRSLYFVVASMVDRFRFLKPGMVLILVFVGVKMLLAHHVVIPALISLGVIVTILAGGVLASILIKPKNEEPH